MKRYFLIRHAESVSNYLKEVMRQEEPDHSITEFRLKIKANPNEDMMDPIPTQKGRLQCADSRQENLHILSKIKYVLVSPFARCLETTSLMFDSKDLRAKGGSIEVRQEIHEKLCCQSDVPTSLISNMSRFPDFDFSKLEEDVQKYRELYFIGSMEEGESKEKIKAFAEKVGVDGTKRERELFMLGLFKKAVMTNTLVENQREMLTRVNKFKKTLKEIFEEKDIQDGELAIVVHNWVIQAWTAEGVDEETGNFYGMIKAKNCEIIECSLE